MPGHAVGFGGSLQQRANRLLGQGGSRVPIRRNPNGRLPYGMRGFTSWYDAVVAGVVQEMAVARLQMAAATLAAPVAVSVPPARNATASGGGTKYASFSFPPLFEQWGKHRLCELDHHHAVPAWW